VRASKQGEAAGGMVDDVDSFQNNSTHVRASIANSFLYAVRELKERLGLI